MLRQKNFNVDDLVPQVRHLPLPWSQEEPLKAFLRRKAKECAVNRGVELYFDHHGNAMYAVSREELLKLLRRQEQRLRSQGKRFASIALKLHKRSRQNSDNQQVQFDFEQGTYAVAAELRRSVDEVAASTNVVPLRPLDEDSLWPIMVAAFTAGGSATAIPSFAKVHSEFVRRQLGISVPEEVFREDLVPVERLRMIYEDLVRTVSELAKLVPSGSEEGGSTRAE